MIARALFAALGKALEVADHVATTAQYRLPSLKSPPGAGFQRRPGRMLRLHVEVTAANDRELRHALTRLAGLIEDPEHHPVMMLSGAEWSLTAERHEP